MRTFCLTGLGLTYGLLLALLGSGVAGGGDGFMVPLYVFGAPFFFPLLMFSPIVLWTIAGFLLSEVESVNWKRAFLGLMIFHYVGIAPYLFFLADWSHGERLWDRSPVMIL